MSQDQPLSPLPAATTKFAVHSDQLRAAARMISLPSRSSDTIRITLSTDELQLSESSENGDFSIDMVIVPTYSLDLSEGDTISFEILKRFVSSWGKHYRTELFFELDKDQDTLAWRGPDHLFHINAPVQFVEAQKHEELQRHLAALDAQTLRDAIRHAAILIDKRPLKLQVYDGLEISGGSAKSGYLSGVSIYKSGKLPENLKFMLPKRNVTNALAAIGKMQSPIDVAETDRAVFIKSGNIELSWNKAGRFPSLERIFDTEMEATFNITVAEALNSVIIATIGSNRGRLVLEQNDQGPSISLLSIATAARYDVALKGKFCECNLSPGMKLEINIDLGDLQRVMLSIRTPEAEVSISNRLLVVKSVCEEYEEVSALAGLA